MDALKFLAREGKGSLTKPGDERDLYGSPMHVACLSNNRPVLEYLLSETEAFDKQYDALTMASSKVNYGGMNVFHICTRTGSIDCLDMLLTFLKAQLTEQIIK